MPAPLVSGLSNGYFNINASRLEAETTTTSATMAKTSSPVPTTISSTPRDGRLARFTPVRRLRKTLYGDTTLCQDVSENSLVVLKRVNLQALRDNTVGAHESPAEERRVIEILARTGGHPHIVRYLPSTSEGSAMFVHRGDLYTAMEFCADGDLFDHVERQPTRRVAEREALELVRQIADALAFLHAHNVAHRDVSLENVLLHDGVAKVCDFGLSCEATSRRYDDIVGKASYMAPEVARGDLYDACAADMWSLGVVLFTLLTGSPLIADETVRDRMLRVVAKYGVVKVLELWGMRDLVRTTTLALLTSLLQVDPTARPRAASLASHPAFWTLHRRR